MYAFEKKDSYTFSFTSPDQLRYYLEYNGYTVLYVSQKPLFWVLSKAERPADASRATEIGSDLKSFIICSFATLNCTNYTIWHAQTH